MQAPPQARRPFQRRPPGVPPPNGAGPDRAMSPIEPSRNAPPPDRPLQNGGSTSSKRREVSLSREIYGLGIFLAQKFMGGAVEMFMLIYYEF